MKAMSAMAQGPQNNFKGTTQPPPKTEISKFKFLTMTQTIMSHMMKSDKILDLLAELLAFSQAAMTACRPQCHHFVHPAQKERVTG